MLANYPYCCDVAEDSVGTLPTYGVQKSQIKAEVAACPLRRFLFSRWERASGDGSVSQGLEGEVIAITAHGGVVDDSIAASKGWGILNGVSSAESGVVGWGLQDGKGNSTLTKLVALPLGPSSS